jgi:hypothetical protein
VGAVGRSTQRVAAKAYQRIRSVLVFVPDYVTSRTWTVSAEGHEMGRVSSKAASLKRYRLRSGMKVCAYRTKFSLVARALITGIGRLNSATTETDWS